jgi:hypothetical protein
MAGFTFNALNYYISSYNGTIWDANVANKNSIQQLVGLNPFLPYPYSIYFNSQKIRLLP